MSSSSKEGESVRWYDGKAVHAVFCMCIGINDPEDHGAQKRVADRLEVSQATYWKTLFEGKGSKRRWHLLAEWADRLSEKHGPVRRKIKAEIEDCFATFGIVVRRYSEDGRRLEAFEQPDG